VRNVREREREREREIYKRREREREGESKRERQAHNFAIRAKFSTYLENVDNESMKGIIVL
jgi:hypothetical protein